MKVTGVETFPIAVPVPHPGGPYWMVLRLDTDEGISGYGEIMLLPIGFRWPVVSAMIDDLVDQALVGHDPYNAEELFDRIYGRAGYSHVPELTKVAILSAFDIACWDIVGKHLGQPVHRLLGGRVRDRLREHVGQVAAAARNSAAPSSARADDPPRPARSAIASTPAPALATISAAASWRSLGLSTFTPRPRASHLDLALSQADCVFRRARYRPAISSMHTTAARISASSWPGATSIPYVSRTRNHRLEISAIVSPSRSISYS